MNPDFGKEGIRNGYGDLEDLMYLQYFKKERKFPKYP
jgi:hypothetical protein